MAYEQAKVSYVEADLGTKAKVLAERAQVSDGGGSGAPRRLRVPYRFDNACYGMIAWAGEV